jgi:hypothetical protein
VDVNWLYLSILFAPTLGFIWLYLKVDQANYQESSDRIKAIFDLENKIKTIGSDFSLLAIRQKRIERMTNRQLRTININLIDTQTPTLPKGRGLKAMISTKDH